MFLTLTDTAAYQYAAPTKKPRLQGCNRGFWVQFDSQVGCRLLAWANRTGQSAVVNTVGGMPQRLAQFDSAAEHLNFFRTASGGVRCDEVFILLRAEVFIVTIAKDCFEDILTMSHAFSEFPEIPRPVQGNRGYKN